MHPTFHRAAALLAPWLLVGCAAGVARSTVVTPHVERALEPASWTVSYRNWTREIATRFRLCFVQTHDPASPHELPSVATSAFTRPVAPKVEELGDQRRRICYSFLGGSVAPRETVVLSVAASGVELAAGVVATWSRDATEIDHTRTESMMGRGGITSAPPVGANAFHLEFVDSIGGVWVEGGRAKAALSDGRDASDAFRYKLDLTGLTAPFDFAVDFSTEGDGPRLGRSWWIRDGQRLGEISESC